MNLIWRFYSDKDNRWRWQQLAFDGTVVEQSKSGYEEYEGCVADARQQGYVFLPSQSTRPQSTAPKVKRSYVRYSTR